MAGETAARRDARSSSQGVVAIDGPSGSGKSTVARRVAQRLGYRYLDTGAMYRAVTWQALDRRIDLEDATALGELAERARIEPGTNPRRPTIVIDGVDVSAPIRTRAVTNAVSAVSAVPAVRDVLVRLQRSLIADGGIVVEGRDIGTTVAPDAPLKVFLTASSEARAARRHRQLAAVGDAAAQADTLAEIERRDQRDSGRAASPLAQAPEAIVVDSTTRTVDEVVGEVLAVAARRGMGTRRRRKAAPAGEAAQPAAPARPRPARKPRPAPANEAVRVPREPETGAAGADNAAGTAAPDPAAAGGPASNGHAAAEPGRPARRRGPRRRARGTGPAATEPGEDGA